MHTLSTLVLSFWALGCVFPCSEFKINVPYALFERNLVKFYRLVLFDDFHPPGILLSTGSCRSRRNIGYLYVATSVLLSGFHEFFELYGCSCVLRADQTRESPQSVRFWVVMSGLGSGTSSFVSIFPLRTRVHVCRIIIPGLPLGLPFAKMDQTSVFFVAACFRVVFLCARVKLVCLRLFCNRRGPFRGLGCILRSLSSVWFVCSINFHVRNKHML